MSKNIVVLISGSGSNLQAIIDACQSGQIDGRISAVVSNKADAYGLVRAENASIPTHTLNHKSFASREDYDTELAKLIDSYQPDLVVLAGFMRILTAGFVQKFVGKMLNIHPSLLPKYQGLNTHQRALDAGDKEHGVSVHFVTEELDGGPVVCQASIDVAQTDTADSLAQRIHVKEHIIYPLVVDWFCKGKLTMKNGQAWLDNKVLPATGIRYVEEN
ncbi:phosphoribosylglycinamide formyltransferase [Catenovulum agarivorans DS-2]|uniref:Phosphoribosylglycinamide formyltransferase n=1 Tax=Catenovulum agarivorans DS-2 TaxID=1328313 RepID=W7QGT8_9ALTE|nr:phosphoribosylglycinamide formyltransferase [Catenovulum agarivorans]EWH12154.1 phosphoribosylglycinamide formyltransferase [Catenovulum agarivorans DS-2]